MIIEGDSVTHNSVVSDRSINVSVLDKKIDSVAVVKITRYRRSKPYGTSFRIDNTTIHDELIRLIHPSCPSYDVNRQVT